MRHNDIQDKINNLFDIYLNKQENEEKNINKQKEIKYNKEFERCIKL